MHEAAIVEYAVNAVRAAATLNKMEHINEIQIRAGALRGIVPGAMERVFHILARNDSMLSTCRLNIQIIPVTVRCRVCGEITTGHAVSALSCGHCGNENIEILKGTELTVAKFSGY